MRQSCVRQSCVRQSCVRQSLNVAKVGCVEDRSKANWLALSSFHCCNVSGYEVILNLERTTVSTSHQFILTALLLWKMQTEATTRTRRITDCSRSLGARYRATLHAATPLALSLSDLHTQVLYLAA